MFEPQQGQPYKGGTVGRVENMVIQDGIKKWEVPITYPDGSTNTLFVPVEGIVFFLNDIPPLSASPPVA